MKKIGYVLLGLIICLLQVRVGFCDELTAAKRNDILKLIEITGSRNMGIQFADNINHRLAQMLKSTNPDMPKRAYEILREETTRLIKSRIDDFINMIVFIYSKYYSDKEIRELIAFYETRLGKKTIEVMPDIMKESMAAGQAWGKSLAPDLVANLEKRIKKEGLSPGTQ